MCSHKNRHYIEKALAKGKKLESMNVKHIAFNSQALSSLPFIVHDKDTG